MHALARTTFFIVLSAAHLYSAHVGATPTSSATPPDSSALFLPPLPPPVLTKLGTADKASQEELEGLLVDLARANPKTRAKSATALTELDSSMLPAIAGKLATLRKNADRDSIARILEGARKYARQEIRTQSKESDGKPDEPTATLSETCALIPEGSGDWLHHVLGDPMPDKEAFRDLVAVLALSRGLRCMGNTAATRELINIYVYFGDLFRVDVQQQLDLMGDRALPAIIEAQYHDSQMVRQWAKRRLDTIGKAIPSEAVRVQDASVLADVLLAYGLVREVEAVRVIVSFANSDRMKVRNAARTAIGQIGAPAEWQLREAYERLMGEKPNRTWDWERTARELFAVYDRARLQEVYLTMELGQTAYKEGRIEDAVEKFRDVLARSPMFERRLEMVPVFVAHAELKKGSDPKAAQDSLRIALTLQPPEAEAGAVRSKLAVLEARQLAARGIADEALLRKALELDPASADAQQLLSQTQKLQDSEHTQWARYAGALLIALVAFLSMILLALAPRRHKVGETVLPEGGASPEADDPPT